MQIDSNDCMYCFENQRCDICQALFDKVEEIQKITSKTNEEAILLQDAKERGK